MQIISYYFEYAGFVNEQSNYSFLESWVALIVFFPFVSRILKKELFSSNVIILLFLISYVPMTSLFRFMPAQVSFFWSYIMYWFFIFFFSFLIPRIKLKRPKTGKKISLPLWGILIILCGAVIFISGYYHGFRFTISISDVYTFREEEKNAGYPTIFSYLMPAAGNILPVFLVYFLVVKNYKWSAFLALIIVLNFSTGGHKSVLFKLFLVFIGFVIFNYKTIYKYSWLLSVLPAFALLELKFLNSIYTSNFLIRRVMFVPGQLNYFYYDFFSKNPSDFYFQGLVGRLGFESEYKNSIARIIGESYYGVDGMNANNGLFSDAYANMNVFGVFFLPIILVIIFKIADSASTGLKGKLLFLPIIAFVMSFNAGFFPSVLLTNGMILLILSLYFYPRKNKLK